MFAYLLAFVAILFVGVFGQACVDVELDATKFGVGTVDEILCRPYLQVPSTTLSQGYTDSYQIWQTFDSYAKTPSTGGITNDVYECFKEFAAYYCAGYFPSCNSSGEATPVCAQTCLNVTTTCASYVNDFIGAGFLRVPEISECNALPTTDCYSPNKTSTWVGFYFDMSDPPIPTAESANCEKFAFNTTRIKNAQADGKDVICRPNYTVPNSYLGTGYDTQQSIFIIFRNLDTYLKDPELFPQNANAEVVITDEMYPCIKALSNFGCGKIFPHCPPGEVLPVQQICRSQCEEVLTACAGNMSIWLPQAAGPNALPTSAQCAALNDYDCYNITNSDTFVGYFYSDFDPPVPMNASTVAPTKKPHRPSSNNDIEYPPHGPGVGGGIGAAVLIGLLGIIGIIMLIMKKQDSR